MTRLAVFDLETTGTDPHEARIVSAYIGLLDSDGSVHDERETIVRPDGFEIPAEATAVHGISTEQALAEGRPLNAVVDELLRLMGDARHFAEALAGQNIVYDLTCLATEAARVGVDADRALTALPVLDSLVLDKKLNKYRKGKRTLITLAPLYGVHLTEEEAHGARADAIAAGRIVQRQLEHEWLRDYDLTTVHRLQMKWYAEQAASLEEWFRRTDPTATLSRAWPVQGPKVDCA